jgi:hypothetical protein
MKTSVVVGIARNRFSFFNAALNDGYYDKGQGFFGPGMMTRNGRGRMGPGMMGDWGRGERFLPMQQYMLDAYAEALGMTSDDLQKELTSGKSMWDVASAKGIAKENYGQFMIDAGTKALDKMVADGEITQKQADAMIETLQQNWQNVDPETCPCIEGFGSRSRMWRWFMP